MRVRAGLTMLFLVGTAAGAEARGLLRPWDLMDLSHEGSHAGVEATFSNLDAGNTDLQVFEFLAGGQFQIGKAVDLWVKLPVAIGEGGSLLGNVGVGGIFGIYDKNTSSGGRLTMAIEGSIWLPSGTDPNDQDEFEAFIGVLYSRPLLLSRWANNVVVPGGAYGIRFKTGKAFFGGNVGFGLAFETEDDNNDDDTHLFFGLGAGGGAEVARNISVLGEFFFIDGDDSDNDTAFGVNVGARFGVSNALTLGAALQKSLDLPGSASLFGLRFDLMGYF